jgi:putative ABC transport system permease protein
MNEMNPPADISFFRLVARNLQNRPYRNIAMILSFAIIAGTLFSAHYLMGGAQQSLENGLNRMGADIMVVPSEYVSTSQTVLLTGEPTTFFFNDSGFEQISRLPGVAKASPEIFVATLFGQSCCSAAVQIIAIDPERDFTIASWLKENPGVTMGKDDIIVGGAIEGAIGSDLRFYGHTFHIVGRLATTGMGIDMAVFTRIEDAYIMAEESGVKAVQKLTIPKGMVSAVFVRTDPGASPEAISEEIRQKVPGTKTLTPNGLVSAVSGQLAAINMLLYGATITVTIVSIPLMGCIAAMVAHERRKEIAILQALGATKSFIVRLMLAESFSLAIIGALAGIITAAIILVGFQDLIAFTLKIPFTIPSPLTLVADGGSALLLCVAIAGIASLYPAYLINRSEPYETIRKGEP